MEEILHRASGGLAEIAFDRPERKNAIAPSTVAALEAARHILAAEAPKVLLLRGEGHTFAAGGDLSDLHAMPAEEALAVMDRMADVLTWLAKAPFPVVAYIEGDAVGGGVEIALAADLVLAAKDARLAFAQVPMGLIPGWGGLGFLERRVGAARARSLLMEGARLTGEEALARGIVDALVSGVGEARRRALGLAAMPPAAIAAVKALTGDDRPDGRELFAALWNSPEHRERVERFFAGGRHGDR